MDGAVALTKAVAVAGAVPVAVTWAVGVAVAVAAAAVRTEGAVGGKKEKGVREEEDGANAVEEAPCPAAAVEGGCGGADVV